MGAFKSIDIGKQENPLHQQQELAIAGLEMQFQAINDFILGLNRNDVVDILTTKDQYLHQGAIVCTQTNLDACKTRGARIYLKTGKVSYEYHWADEITKIKKPKKHTFQWFC